MTERDILLRLLSTAETYCTGKYTGYARNRSSQLGWDEAFLRYGDSK